MKIGQFAKKHGVTHDTIRYYIEKGLLVPNKKDGQYRFSEVDSNEIEKIIQLKYLQFSLSDIQKILTYQRLGGTSTDFFRKQFLILLEEKKKNIYEEILKLNGIYESLNEEITELLINSEEDEYILGFPLETISLLQCPSCEKQVELSAGALEKNMIMSAMIQCTCGYKAMIQKGVYIDERDVRTKLVNGKPIPSKEEYFKQASSEEISHLFKGMAQLIESINRYEAKPMYVMELSNCVGFFLLQYIEYLHEDTIYILIDHDIDRLSSLKKNLEKYYSHRKFLFFCCDYNNVPIKRKSIDVVVDLFMTQRYEKEYNKYLIDIIVSYMKDEGLLAGIYACSKGKEVTDIHMIEKINNDRRNIEYYSVHRKSDDMCLLEDIEIEHTPGSIGEEIHRVFVTSKVNVSF